MKRPFLVSLMAGGVVAAVVTTLAAAPASAAPPPLATAAAEVVAPGFFGSLPPARVLDTRFGIGAPEATVAPGGTLTVDVTGVGGVPNSGVSAVVFNLTVTAPTAAGYVTAFASGSSRPEASNVNFEAATTVANLVIAPVGADGKVSLYNGAPGTVHLIADISGYYLGSGSPPAGGFGAVAPVRVLDSRIGLGTPPAAVNPDGTISVDVTGLGGVPDSGVSAVVLNLTVTAPTAAGYVTAFASGTSKPLASNLNFLAGATVANLVIAPVGADGRISLYNGAPGSVHLVADISGYFVPASSTPAGGFGPVAPLRILDTRIGVGAPAAAVGPGGTIAVDVTGIGGVPDTGVAAVVLNLTVTAPTGSGYLTAFGSGTPQPFASNLNFLAGQTVANLVIAPVGADGKVALYNGSSGSAQLVADVSGYFTFEPVSDDGAVHSDQNGDGVTDLIRWDFGDGTWQELRDLDYDGTADVLAIDTNGDDTADFQILDNEDGTYTVYQDSDSDGVYETQQDFTRDELDDALPGISDLLDTVF